jgi:membrane-bound metal-dependent hydrolase YbcI (DUF457 family)
VDPISHAVLGQALATVFARETRARRTLLAAGVLGALAPDVDAVLMPFGWDLYLRAHEIGTHTLAGSVPLACAVALVVGLVARTRSGLDLVVVGWLGSVSHIALDVLSGARIQIGWPVVAGRVSLPLVAMADPWLLGLLVAGGIGLAMPGRRPRRRAAWLAAGMAAFFGLKATLLVQAVRGGAHAGQAPALERIVEAQWASLTGWYVFTRERDTLTQWRVEVGRPWIRLVSWPTVPDSPRVRASRSLNTVRNFLHVHELGFAVELPDVNGGAQVLWSDLRFCRKQEDGAGVMPDPVLLRDTPAGPVRLACALWFGGAFDAGGGAIRQLVKVAGRWQMRAPPP